MSVFPRQEVRAFPSADAALTSRQTTARATKPRFFAAQGVIKKLLMLNVLTMIRIHGQQYPLPNIILVFSRPVIARAAGNLRECSTLFTCHMLHGTCL